MASPTKARTIEARIEALEREMGYGPFGSPEEICLMAGSMSEYDARELADKLSDDELESCITWLRELREQQAQP